MISNCTTVRSNMFTVERRARRVSKAWSIQTSQGSSSRRKDTARMFTKANFFRCYVSTKAKFYATGLARYAKVSMYIVDSGASLHVMAPSSLNDNEKKTIRQSNNIFWVFRPPVAFWFQTRRSRSISWSLALICGYVWWKILRQCYCWEDHAMSLVFLCRGASGNTSRSENKCKKVIECSIENFILVVAVRKQQSCTIHRILTHQRKL